MKNFQKVLMGLGALTALFYVGKGVYFDTTQESLRTIERSRFGVLFRETSSSPRAEVYNNKEGRTFSYRDTVDTRDGNFQVIEVRLCDTPPIDVRNAKDEISGRVTTIGRYPEGEFVIQGPYAKQKITEGLVPGSLTLSRGLFTEEGSQDHIERLYRLLEESLAMHSY